MTKAKHLDILVVEDEASLRGLLTMVLQHHGYEVAVAGNGLAATAFLAGGGAARLILLDMMMPVMDGLRFLAWLRENPGHLENTKIIVLSAYQFGDDRDSSARNLDLVAAFVSKPIAPAELIKAVHGVLHGNA